MRQEEAESGGRWTDMGLTMKRGNHRDSMVLRAAQHFIGKGEFTSRDVISRMKDVGYKNPPYPSAVSHILIANGIRHHKVGDSNHFIIEG